MVTVIVLSLISGFVLGFIAGASFKLLAFDVDGELIRAKRRAEYKPLPPPPPKPPPK